MAKFIFLAINLITILKFTSSVIIDCNYNSNTAYEVIGNVYQCEVKNDLNIKSREDAVIEYSTGTHVASKNNDDVICFSAVGKNVDFIPRGLEKIFKNLKAIYVPNGRIKELRQVDLKSYSNLVYLDFGGCDIKIIEDGTFDFNPNLEIVWFNFNKIFHVDPNVFKNLNKLSFLGMMSNPCINIEVRNNLGQVKVLIESVKEKCFDEDFYKISQDLKSLENDAKKLKLENFQNWNEKRENLEENFKTSRFTNLNSLTEKFENLKQKLPILQINFLNQVEHNLKNSQIESCSIIDGKFSAFGEKIEKFDENLIQIDQKLNKTDEKISNLIEQLSDFEEKFDKCDNVLKNLTTSIYQKLQNIESEQQNLKSKFQEFNEKVERKFVKIDEKTKKVIEALQDE